VAMQVAVQVGRTHYVMETPCLPAIGTGIMVDKAFSGDGVEAVVEVVAHEWRIVNAGQTEANEPEFNVTVKTRMIRE
jgi:hypothetical protein